MTVYVDPVVMVVIGAVLYTYALAAVVIAALTWFDADRPRWRALQWLRLLAAGPVVYVQLIIAEWRVPSA